MMPETVAIDIRAGHETPPPVDPPEQRPPATHVMETAEARLNRNHTARRPSWDCEACGRPWPCLNAKELLLMEFRGYPSMLTIYMSALLCEALIDLMALEAGQPGDLYDRFLAWVYLVADQQTDDDPTHAGL